MQKITNKVKCPKCVRTGTTNSGFHRGKQRHKYKCCGCNYTGGASASACCMVFKLGVPHEKSGKTFFGNYKEDGFRKKKNLGRVEQVDSKGKSMWESIEKEWIYLYQNREVKARLSAVALVTSSDEWLCEAYMETDYSSLNSGAFQTVFNNFLAYQIKNMKNKKLKHFDLSVNKWGDFRIGDIFCKIKAKHFSKIPDENGDLPFISSKSDNNGVAGYVDADGIKGNCITISTNGSCFDCFYQPEPIAISNDVEALYNENLNMYNAMFIITVMNLEKVKYNYGRKPKNGKIYDTVIKLPITSSGKPDWHFMENYIKSFHMAIKIHELLGSST